MNTHCMLVGDFELGGPSQPFIILYLTEGISEDFCNNSNIMVMPFLRKLARST